MKPRVAIIGAGVSGLTGAVVLAESGLETNVFAEETGDETNSAAAAAIWYPYDVGPEAAVIPWALVGYGRFLELAQNAVSGVSVIELRTFSRRGPISPPRWAEPFAPRPLADHELPKAFSAGFSLRVPLIETTKYLSYLRHRVTKGGVPITGGIRFDNFAAVDERFDLIVDCAGIGARDLAQDGELEPHRGQVAIVEKIDLPYAVVCDDAPLMYAIPRSNDCVLGGTNEVSDDRTVDRSATAAIVSECERTLGLTAPALLRERVGLRPCRKSGVRLEVEALADGRRVIHNYGHGGAGFTLSWGCAQTVRELALRP